MANSTLRKAALAAILSLPLVSGLPSFADPKFEIAPISQGALPGSLIHDPMNIQWKPDGSNYKADVVASEGVPGGQAISIRVKRKAKKPWDMNLRAPFRDDIKKGETIEVYFWARASKLQKGKETGRISAVIGRNVEPYDTIAVDDILPTSEWKMYKISGTAERDFGNGKSDMGFNLGAAKQTIEFGPFYAVTLGQNAEPTPPQAQSAASDTAAVTETATGVFDWTDGVESAAVPGQTADVSGLAVTVGAQPTNKWDAVAGSSAVNMSVAQNDTVSLNFWARTVSGPGQITAIVQRNSEPYDAVISQDVTTSADWQEYTISGVSGTDVMNGMLGVAVHVGQAAQSIELGSFELSKSN